MEIKITTNYSMFKTLTGNRDVTPSRVKKIKDSIESHGYFTNPIIVNEKYEVVDGQGRLEALRQLEMPVEYLVVPGLKIQQGRIYNSVGETWDIKDFIKSYASTGIESYQFLLELINQYKVHHLIVLRAINRSQSIGPSLRDGSFKMTAGEYWKACQNLPKYVALMTAFKRFKPRQSVCLAAIGFLIDHNYPVESIVDCCMKTDPKTIYAESTSRLLETLEKAYNKNRKKASQIHPYVEWLKNK